MKTVLETDSEEQSNEKKVTYSSIWITGIKWGGLKLFNKEEIDDSKDST